MSAVVELFGSLWPVALALGVGACLVVQASLNSALRGALGHFGWLGVPPQPSSPARLIGAGLVLVGIALIRA